MFAGGRLELAGILYLEVLRRTEGVIALGNLGILACLLVIGPVRGGL